MDIFDVITMSRLKSAAETANKIGTLGRCSVMVIGEYQVSLMFELESCFQTVLVSANDVDYESSCNNGGAGKPPCSPR